MKPHYDPVRQQYPFQDAFNALNTEKTSTFEKELKVRTRGIIIAVVGNAPQEERSL